MVLTFLAALAPALIDIFKQASGAAVNKWIGLSVDEQIRLQQADVGRMQALAALDNPYGNPATWVVNLRASFRYIAAIISIIAGVALGAEVMTNGYDPEQKAALLLFSMDLIGIPFGFIFGERMRLRQ